MAFGLVGPGALPATSDEKEVILETLAVATQPYPFPVLPQLPAI